jgi:cytochrome b561
MSAPPELRYHPLSLLLHWLSALAVFAQIGFGWALQEIPRRTPERTVFVNAHKSFGLCIGALIVLRLLWRLRHPAPPLPETMPAWERQAARANHALLYACLLVMPAAGYIASNFSRFGVRFFGLALPPWGPNDPQVYAFFQRIHVAASVLLVALILLHLLAAVKHAWVDRDAVLGRMLPRAGR